MNPHTLPDGRLATPQNSLYYPHRTKEAEAHYQARLTQNKTAGKARSNLAQPQLGEEPTPEDLNQVQPHN